MYVWVTFNYVYYLYLKMQSSSALKGQSIRLTQSIWSKLEVLQGLKAAVGNDSHPLLQVSHCWCSWCLFPFFLQIPFHFNNIILESWKKYFCSACSLTLVEMFVNYLTSVICLWRQENDWNIFFQWNNHCKSSFCAFE